MAFSDGAFRIVGTDRAVGIAQVAARLPAMLAGQGWWKPDTPTFPNGCHVAEVEINPQTGDWRLAAYSMVHDFGP